MQEKNKSKHTLSPASIRQGVLQTRKGKSSEYVLETDEKLVQTGKVKRDAICREQKSFNDNIK